MKFAKRTLEKYLILENDTRKKLWDYIQKKPHSVTEIKNHLGISYKGTIAHINKLEELGIVERERQKVPGGIVLVKPVKDAKKKFFSQLDSDFEKSKKISLLFFAEDTLKVIQRWLR